MLTAEPINAARKELNETMTKAISLVFLLAVLLILTPELYRLFIVTHPRFLHLPVAFSRFVLTFCHAWRYTLQGLGGEGVS